ncbi:MAG: hypothetical protein GX288_00520 [Clostridiales bacterium]|nr:hypothetical protein [Clostridiales bacterium]
MNAYEIILIILGVICIVVSSIVIDKSNKSSDKNIDNNLDNFKNMADNEIIRLKNRLDEILAEASENTIITTENYLDKLSNEKITALSEYSDEVLEKINRNHEEVVFLYQMLNDKEEQLKNAISEFNSNSQRIYENKYVSDMDKEASEKKEQITISDQDSEGDINNHNNLILEEYKKGKSIIEISKSLGIGQGEVKLVVDLYKGFK